MTGKIRVFISVGTQLSFPRMINIIEEAMSDLDVVIDAIWQVGDMSEIPELPGKVYRFMGPGEYKEAVNFADVLISHAGMGSILTAVECSKPIIIIPRNCELQEHRNDHQASTVREFGSIDGVYVADTVKDVTSWLGKAMNLECPNSCSLDDKFLQEIVEFIES